MPGQNIEIGRREALAIGVVVFGAVVLLVSLTGGDGTTPVPEPGENESADLERSEIAYGERISAGDYIESIELVGAYRGHGFREVYPSSDDPRMRLTRQLRPGDGVVEAWISGRFANVSTDPVFVASIYVDQDFRAEVGSANLAWGYDWSNFRPYDYEEVQPGIYRDRVVDGNVSRFRRFGATEGEANVAVGNFSRGMVGFETAVSQETLTLVSAR